MNGVCENVRALLAARLDGALPEDRARQVDAHLAVCADCAELAAALQLGREGLAGAPSADLTGPVLAATSGPACPRCRAALAVRAEGGLAGAEAALVEGHLEHCDACRAVAEVLDWLPAVLPTLAEVEAGEDFVDEVLRRTSRAPLPLWRRLGREAAARLRRLSQRPLFPVEAAYVATLVAVLLFGTGVSPLRQAPQRALDWLRGEDVAAPRVAGAPVLRDLGATGGRLADEAGGAASTGAAVSSGPSRTGPRGPGTAPWSWARACAGRATPCWATRATN